MEIEFNPSTPYVVRKVAGADAFIVTDTRDGQQFDSTLTINRLQAEKVAYRWNQQDRALSDDA